MPLKSALQTIVRSHRGIARSSPLLVLSMMETGAPLIRILILAHLLNITELGFAAVLTSFIQIVDLSTDIAIHRFIYSAPRDKFDEAVAAAHALAVARGIALTVLALVVAPFAASAVALGAQTKGFLMIAPTILLGSFEHLGPKTAERNFEYGPQIRTKFAGYAVGLMALVAVALRTHSHLAIIGAAYAQAFAVVVASRFYSGTPYRLDFRSPLFVKAFKYAYPLVFNGMGLAVALHGDRFLVAVLFNLQTVAIYTIVVTTAVYPAQVINRFFSTTIVARFYHASVDPNRLRGEVRLTSKLSAIVGAFYAGGVIFLTDVVATTVFGPKFFVSNLSLMLLGVGVYVRFIRLEPFNALMLNVGKTKRLAASNLLVASSLAYMVVITMVYRTMEAVLLTRALGEMTALFVTIIMARQVPQSGRLVFSSADLFGGAFVGSACLGLASLSSFGPSIVLTLAACVAYTLAIALWAAVELREDLVSIGRADNERLTGGE